MVKIADAAKQAGNVIDRHLSDLKSTYKNVECNYGSQGLSLTCTSGVGESISLKIIPDYERRKVKALRGMDYQKQGGHKGLIKQFNRHNPEAWKIEVKTSTGGLFYETAFGGNENNWDVDVFGKDMLTVFKK